MKNKKGQLAIALTTGGLIVIAVIVAIVLISIFGLTWFLTTNLLTILGGAVIILAMVYGFTALMRNPSQTKIAIFTIVWLLTLIKKVAIIPGKSMIDIAKIIGITPA